MPIGGEAPPSSRASAESSALRHAHRSPRPPAVRRPPQRGVGSLSTFCGRDRALGRAANRARRRQEIDRHRCRCAKAEICRIAGRQNACVNSAAADRRAGGARAPCGRNAASSRNSNSYKAASAQRPGAARQAEDKALWQPHRQIGRSHLGDRWADGGGTRRGATHTVAAATRKPSPWRSTSAG